jgi:hypothetical protein
MNLRSAPPLWLWPNLLSLDAPLIALLWQYLFSRCFHAQLGVIPATLLACAVWLIYVADRVLDVNRQACSSPRHLFCWNHRKLLLPIWTAVFATAAWIALTRLPSALLIPGLAVLGAVLGYLFAIHCSGREDVWTKAARSKEAVVGLLFGLGTTVAAWQQVRTLADFATIALFSGLCWLNCVAIETWEARGVTGSGFSWTISLGAASVAALAVALFWGHRPVLGGAEVASAVGLLVLDRGRQRFSPNALRVLADVALLSPIVFLPIAGSV